MCKKNCKKHEMNHKMNRKVNHKMNHKMNKNVGKQEAHICGCECPLLPFFPGLFPDAPLDVKNFHLYLDECMESTNFYHGGNCRCDAVDFMVVDLEGMAEKIAGQTGIDKENVRKVLATEEKYLMEIGICGIADGKDNTGGDVSHEGCAGENMVSGFGGSLNADFLMNLGHGISKVGKTVNIVIGIIEKLGQMKDPVSTPGAGLPCIFSDLGNSFGGAIREIASKIGELDGRLTGFVGPAGIVVAVAAGVGLGVKLLWDNCKGFRKGVTNIRRGIKNRVSVMLPSMLKADDTLAEAQFNTMMETDLPQEKTGESLPVDEALDNILEKLG